MQYQVLLFYKYVTVSDPDALAARIRSLAESYSLKGRVIVAEEGINATMEGLTENTEAFATIIRSDERFSDMSIKKSEGTGATFPKLKVKVRSEIVSTQFPQELADPRIATAPRISAEELRTWYQNDKDFVVVDMRNDYEFSSGHFAGSVNPGLSASRDLPSVLDRLAPLKEKTVLTVCTGGVRCEKMSAYLMSQGFNNVHQLEDGIHGYMEKYPGKDFNGTLYTFDQRVVMDFGGDRTIVGQCKRCDAATENYVNCAYDPCHVHFLACSDCTNPEGTFCSEVCANA